MTASAEDTPSEALAERKIANGAGHEHGSGLRAIGETGSKLNGRSEEVAVFGDRFAGGHPDSNPQRERDLVLVREPPLHKDRAVDRPGDRPAADPAAVQPQRRFACRARW